MEDYSQYQPPASTCTSNQVHMYLHENPPQTCMHVYMYHTYKNGKINIHQWHQKPRFLSHTACRTHPSSLSDLHITSSFCFHKAERSPNCCSSKGNLFLASSVYLCQLPIVLCFPRHSSSHSLRQASLTHHFHSTLFAFISHRLARSTIISLLSLIYCHSSFSSWLQSSKSSTKSLPGT